MPMPILLKTHLIFATMPPTKVQIIETGIREINSTNDSQIKITHGFFPETKNNITFQHVKIHNEHSAAKPG